MSLQSRQSSVLNKAKALIKAILLCCFISLSLSLLLLAEQTSSVVSLQLMMDYFRSINSIKPDSFYPSQQSGEVERGRREAGRRVFVVILRGCISCERLITPGVPRAET